MNEVILIVDDDTEFVEYARLCLEGIGYHVVTAFDGSSALNLANDLHPDVIALDVTMPGLDGWETCRRLKGMSDAPVIMLSARGRVRDVVRGLELGADDYLVKPFTTRELLARLQALLRRRQAARNGGRPSAPVYKVRDLEVDTVRQRATLRGRHIALTPTEYKLLSCLVRHAGRVLPHGFLLLEVWGTEYVDRPDFLKMHVHHLRQKIEDDPAQPGYVVTHWGVGYLMIDQ